MRVLQDLHVITEQRLLRYARALAIGLWDLRDETKLQGQRDSWPHVPPDAKAQLSSVLRGLTLLRHAGTGQWGRHVHVSQMMLCRPCTNNALPTAQPGYERMQ